MQDRSAWPFVRPSGRKLPATLPSGKPWPKISIVTPTFRQAAYIEETILSVAHQDYPHCEHIIIDGGSDDGTVDIIRKHESKLAYWESEKDRGQSHALNKGFARTTGDILTWLNSDDLLAPGALAAVAIAHDMTRADMFAGVCELFNSSGFIIHHLTACGSGTLAVSDFLDEQLVGEGFSFYQPEVMFTRDLWERAGGKVDENLQYVMDYDLWLRFAAAWARIEVLGRPIAQFRVHEAQKTYALTAYGEATSRHQLEVEQVRARYQDVPSAPSQFPRRTARPDTERRSRLKIYAVNDIGFLYGAGLAHKRFLEALTFAGHEVRYAQLGDETRVDRALTTHAFPDIERDVAEGNYDLVFAGNIHAATRSADVLARLSNRVPVAAAIHDLFMITGRCAHPGTCLRYLTRCDSECPTAEMYPPLDRNRIAYEHGLKKSWFTSETPPLLLANSAWTADITRRGMPAMARAKVAEANLAFPTHLFRPRDKASLRHKLGLPLDRTIVAFAAATVDDPAKGFAELLELFDSVASGGVAFLCIGRLDNPVLFDQPDMFTTGLVLDEWRMAEWLAAADVYVTASRLETFGQTVVEAALSGVPVVAYRATGLASAVIDGVSGLLVDPEERGGLEKAVRRLIEDPELREAIGVWGRIASENRRSYAASYHTLHRAFLAASILEIGRDAVGIRFQPQLSRTWFFDGGGEEQDTTRAYRPSVSDGAMRLDVPGAL